MIPKVKKFSNGAEVFPIGIGMWGIGGLTERDPDNNDEKQIKALSYMLQKGMNFVELCPWYADWKSIELFVDAVKDSKININNIFIVSSIYPYKNEKLKDARYELEKLLKMLGRNKTDSIQFTFSGFLKWGVKDSIKFYKQLLDEKLTEYVSITNENLSTLKLLYKEFGKKLLSQEIHFSFEIRENEVGGLIGFADNKEIINVIFQPLRRNKTTQRNWPLLVQLSKKYGKTQNQILLNWLVSRGFLPITKSETTDHIDEHLASLDFMLASEDIKELDDFRVPNYKSPKIDWDRTGEGVPVHQLPNIFDDIMDGKYEPEK